MCETQKRDYTAWAVTRIAPEQSVNGITVQAYNAALAERHLLVTSLLPAGTLTKRCRSASAAL